MTDNFTCPDCGWPRGRTHAERNDNSDNRVHVGVHDDGTDALALTPTDAKEGEEDGLSGTSAVPANGNDERLARRIVTPDIAGLVERLQVANKANCLDLCEEAADALERLEAAKDAAMGCVALGNANYEAMKDRLTAAKAEIEEYRKKLGRMNYVSPQEALLRAENERLRAALEKIATHHHPQTRGCNYDAEFARAALTGRGE